MTYEWDEEIPQPKPPTNRVALKVQTLNWSKQAPLEASLRDATQADIARALVVTEAELSHWLKNRDLARQQQAHPYGGIIQGAAAAQALANQQHIMSGPKAWVHVGDCPPGCTCQRAQGK